MWKHIDFDGFLSFFPADRIQSFGDEEEIRKVGQQSEAAEVIKGCSPCRHA